MERVVTSIGKEALQVYALPVMKSTFSLQRRFHRIQVWLPGLCGLALVLQFLVIHSPSLLDLNNGFEDPECSNPIAKICTGGANLSAREVQVQRDFMTKKQSDPSKKRGVIMAWTEQYTARAVSHVLSVEGCEAECLVTSDRSLLPHAGLSLFKSSDLNEYDLPPPGPNGVKQGGVWVYESLEPPIYDWRNCGFYTIVHLIHRKLLSNPKSLLKRKSYCTKLALRPSRLLQIGFDVTNTIHPGTFQQYIQTGFQTYGGDRLPVMLRHEVAAQLPNRKKQALVGIHNGMSFNGREKWIEAFMKYYPVYSFGKVLHTGDWPAHIPEGTYEGDKEVYKSYRYGIALENSNCQNFVTERLWRLWNAGLIPIYDGPRDRASEHMPLANTAIFIEDFSGPKAVADYLKRLDEDDELYLSHFPETEDDIRPELKEMLKKAHRPFVDCNMCRMAAGVDPPKYRVVEDFQKLNGACELDKMGKWDREYYSDGTMSGPIYRSYWMYFGFGMDWVVLGGVLALLNIFTCIWCGCKLRRKYERPKTRDGFTMPQVVFLGLAVGTALIWAIFFTWLRDTLPDGFYKG